MRRLDHLQAAGCGSKQRENTASTNHSIICLSGSRKICCLREKGKRRGKQGQEEGHGDSVGKERGV